MATKVDRRPVTGTQHEQISVRLTAQEAKAVDRLVTSGFFMNRADFLRAAAREKLLSLRIEDVRDVSKRQAQKEILEYLGKHALAYPSDIADALALDLELVMDVVAELLARRKVEEATPHGHA